MWKFFNIMTIENNVLGTANVHFPTYEGVLISS